MPWRRLAGVLPYAAMSPLRLAPALLLVALSACPGPGDRTGGGQVAPDGGGKGKPGGSARDKPAGPGGPAAGALLPAEGIACAASSCVYHAGGDGYFACLAGGGGTCFHYGAPCEPAARCMYHRGAAAYRTCDKVREGRCVTYGAACEPPGRCMFDARDGLHRTCKRVDQGRCVEPGPVCDP